MYIKRVKHVNYTDCIFVEREVMVVGLTADDSRPTGGHKRSTPSCLRLAIFKEYRTLKRRI